MPDTTLNMGTGSTIIIGYSDDPDLPPYYVTAFQHISTAGWWIRVELNQAQMHELRKMLDEALENGND